MTKTPIDLEPIRNRIRNIIHLKEQYSMTVKFIDESCAKFGFSNDVIRDKLSHLENEMTKEQGNLKYAIEYNTKLKIEQDLENKRKKCQTF